MQEYTMQGADFLNMNLARLWQCQKMHKNTGTKIRLNYISTKSMKVRNYVYDLFDLIYLLSPDTHTNTSCL